MPRPAPWIDRTAISLSGLCLLHCLAGLLLFGLVSTAGWAAFSHDVHAWGLALAAPLAAVALWRGWRLHGRSAVALLGGMGVGFMTGAVLAPHGLGGELFLSIAGVGALMLAHGLNLRWMQSART